MRVLIAEDETVSRRVLETSLQRWGYETVVASDGTEAWEIIQAGDPPSLMVLDWVMPGMLGVEICAKAHELDWAVHPYIILLTGKDSKNDIVEGFRAGADDYVSKPFDPEELKARIHAGHRIQKLQMRLLEVEQALRHQATHDTLTGVPNRRAILAHLEQHCGRAQRSGESISVVMVDIDHFKAVNDSFGHSSGDQVLTEAARRMSGEMRSYEDFGRYGGEEFLAVLAPCDAEGAVCQADRLRKTLLETEFRIPGGHIPVTASFGIASAGGDDCDPDALIQQADAALYRAKADGRNCIRSATPADVNS